MDHYCNWTPLIIIILLLFCRVVPILLNGMKYSDYDVILLKVCFIHREFNLTPNTTSAWGDCIILYSVYLVMCMSLNPTRVTLMIKMYQTKILTSNHVSIRPRRREARG